MAYEYEIALETRSNDSLAHDALFAVNDLIRDLSLSDLEEIEVYPVH